MPQLFLKINKCNSVILFIINIVDDIFSCGSDNDLKLFLHQFSRVFEACSIFHAHGKLKFYHLPIAQADDFSCVTDAGDKLQAIKSYSINHTSSIVLAI